MTSYYRVWHIAFAFDPDVGDEPVGPVYECPLNHTVVLHFPSTDPLPDWRALLGISVKKNP